MIVGEVGSLARPFRWKQESELVCSGLPANGSNRGYANDVSGDGLSIAGYSEKLNGDNLAFSWREGVGFQDLGFPPGDRESVANGISGDGNRIVGYSRRADFRAVLWDGANGIRDLRRWLVNDFGLNLNGWLLDTAYAISSDGNTIVGVRITPKANEKPSAPSSPNPPPPS